MSAKGYEQKIIYEKVLEHNYDYLEEDRGINNRFARIDRQIGEAEEEIGFNFYAPVVSDKKFFKRLAINFKRAIRKSVAWILIPMFYEQTRKNSRFTAILLEMSDLLKELNRNQKQTNQELSERLNKSYEKFAAELRELNK